MMQHPRRAAGAIALVAISFVSALLAATVQLSFPLRVQEHTEWCWAATSQAVLAYYGTSVSQCGIANFATGRSDCCNSYAWSAPHPCNGSNNLFGSSAWGVPNGSVQGILAQGGVQSVALMSPLAQGTIITELAAGRPFVMRWAWTSGGGHELVGYGHEQDATFVDYMDPWPGNGYTRALYGWVVNGSDHQWTHTLRITTGFAKSSPTNGANGLSTSVMLTWAAMLGATSYQVCVDTTNNGACDTGWTSVGTSTSAQLSTLSAGTTYYWQVRATVSGNLVDGTGGWWSFATGTGPPPFGQVDTPVQNAAGVVGAIAVTGWALDDAGIASVKIYRTCLAFEPQNCQSVGGASVVYIGDAAFIAGARPDVEAAYPAYPQANRAGWGYLLLTNMLPHVTNQLGFGGQGPLRLYAFATDAEGKVTLLGRTTADHSPTSLTMANDTMAKPFGAIDTPGQGATVSGTLVNFGWALTPDTDTAAGGGDILIPVTGSTMNVIIDGVAVGKVGYNQCRGTVGNPVSATGYCNDDVANIFGNATPQASLTLRTGNLTKFRNVDVGRAAIGAFSFNTGTLTNGVHTIVWGVTDSAGRADGIGSRYFTVLNTGPDADATAGARAAARPAETEASAGGAARGAGVEPGTAAVVAALQDAAAAVRGDARALADLVPASGEVSGRTGFDLTSDYDVVPVDADGVRRIQLAELGRLELQLGRVDGGYLVANGTLRDLPPGSHLDPATGQFTWAPGVGYVGTYRLTFVRGDAQIPVDVTIRPTTTAASVESEIRMHVDVPVSGQVVAGTFTVAGWALDPQASFGSGIGAVHVWAQRRDAASVPEFLGAAALGGRRPDVAEVYGAVFGTAGFSLTTSGLAPGTYDVTAYAWNRRTARWEDARTVAVSIR